MSARNTISQARKLGVPLGESEAEVALAADSALGSRAWFGTDFRGRPVAYFEIGDQSITPFAVSQVIDVAPVETTIGDPAEEVRTAKVTCREPRLDDVFIAFMDDVTEQLGTDNAVSILVNSAASWRNLLRIARHGLSDSAAMGLFGELKFLEALTEHIGPNAVELWQRDANSVHDFIGEDVRVEVKASTFQNQQAVKIHGLKQLEVPAHGDLVLAVAEVEKHGTGETLDLVVETLLDLGIDLETLSTKLEKSGFVRGMTSGESPPTFVLRDWRFWEITGSSPVLNTSAVSNEVATAIEEIQYSLNLGALGDSSPDFVWDRLAPISSD